MGPHGKKMDEMMQSQTGKRIIRGRAFSLMEGPLRNQAYTDRCCKEAAWITGFAAKV